MIQTLLVSCDAIPLGLCRKIALSSRVIVGPLPARIFIGALPARIILSALQFAFFILCSQPFDPDLLVSGFPPEAIDFCLVRCIFVPLPRVAGRLG